MMALVAEFINSKIYAMFIRGMEILPLILPISLGWLMASPFGWLFLAIIIGVTEATRRKLRKGHKLSTTEKILLVIWSLYSLALFFWLPMVFWGWADGNGSEELSNWYLKWNIGCLSVQLLLGSGVIWWIKRGRRHTG